MANKRGTGAADSLMLTQGIDDVDLLPAKKVGPFKAVFQLLGFGQEELNTEFDDGINVPSMSTATSSVTVTQNQFDNAIMKSRGTRFQRNKLQFALVGGAVVSALAAFIIINLRSSAEAEFNAAEASIAELDSASRTIGRTASSAALGDATSLQALEAFISRTNTNLSNIYVIAPEANLRQFELIGKNSLAIFDKRGTIGGVDKKLNIMMQDSELIRAYSEQLNALVVQRGAGNEATIASNRVYTGAVKIRSRIEEITSGNSTERSMRALSEEMQSLMDRVMTFERLAAASDTDIRNRLTLLKYAQNRMLLNFRNIRSRLNDVSLAKISSREVTLLSEGANQVIPRLQADVSAARNHLSILQMIAAVLAITSVSLIAALFLLNARKEKIRSEQIQAEKDASDHAMERMLQELVTISSGDLSYRVTVTGDRTAVIGDAINLTINELSRVVKDINSSAKDVSVAIQNFVTLMKLITSMVDEQEAEVNAATTSIGNLTESIIQISNSAQSSLSVAEQSLAASQAGVDVVQKTIDGMDNIRQNISETSKRIKRLGESTQEIGAISDVIKELAMKTHILSLNSYIQAEGAGEQGLGFRVIAREIQDLVKLSQEGTVKIASLIQTIQSDTQEAMHAMERSIQGVIDGTSLADEAGKQLEQIREVSDKMAKLVDHITTAAQNQKEDAANVNQRMVKIMQTARESSRVANDSRRSVEDVGATVNRLSQSVTNFKT